MLTTGKNSSSGLLTNNLFKGSYWKLAFTNYELSGAKGACELIIVGPTLVASVSRLSRKLAAESDRPRKPLNTGRFAAERPRQG